MFLMEYEVSEQEVLTLVQEAFSDSKNSKFRELIIDPIIFALEKEKCRKDYIKYGNDFLDANVEMLSKEYPTTPTKFPRKYVDDVLNIFGFNVKSLKKTLEEVFSDAYGHTSFRTILMNPSNAVHAVALFYADVNLNRKLRDSAKQQLGLSEYYHVFMNSFPKGELNESVMAYTYMNLNRTWNLVKSENVINWIGDSIESSYGYHRSKMTLDISTKVMVDFLNRVRNSLRQNMVQLANRYYENIDEGNASGQDVQTDDEYVISSNFTNYRDNLLRLIKMGDKLYTDKNAGLYTATARFKNVKVETLYEFAQRIDHKDIGLIIDTIFYVFIVKEEHDFEDINSNKYISRMSNFPTAIDRAIKGKPIIMPISKKYKVQANIVKSYIYLIATFILLKFNDIKS